MFDSSSIGLTETSAFITLPEFARSAPVALPTPRPAVPPRPRDSAALADVLRHPGIWRRGTAAPSVDVQPTGLAELDAQLPGGGWPRGAVCEILVEQDGIGECRLLLPAL